jgi:phage tail sheath gpL-like
MATVTVESGGAVIVSADLYSSSVTANASTATVVAASDTVIEVSTDSTLATVIAASGQVITVAAGNDGADGDRVIKIRVSEDATVDVSIYNSIVLTALCTVTLINNTDDTRVRIYNASTDECVIIGLVEDVLDPIIYPYETFSMEYNLNELRWSI